MWDTLYLTPFAPAREHREADSEVVKREFRSPDKEYGQARADEVIGHQLYQAQSTLL
jgi:hypothetical protein